MVASLRLCRVRPHSTQAVACYVVGMNLIVIMLVMLLLFGVGGFFVAGPVIGASVLGLMLGLCLFVYLLGAFRTKI